MDNIFIDLLYPRRCPMCGDIVAFGQGYLCDKHKSLPYVEAPCCLRCGKEIADDTKEYCDDCTRHKRDFVRGYPVFNYIEPVKSSILAVKYKNKREYCDFYGMEMARKIKPALARMGLDAIVPVPIHKHKKRQRGYNQAELLADVVGKCLGIQVISDMLVRTIDTKPLKELDNVQRANNMKFAIKKGRVHDACRNVLLVDDIYTTGATAQICTELLQEMGVEHVYVTVACIGKGR